MAFVTTTCACTLPDLFASAHLELEAVYTHFANADELGDPLFDRQVARFETALGDVTRLGGHYRFRHAANSAALLRGSRAWYDRVRPGLLLYGVVPAPFQPALPLAPVMSLVSRITAVKGVRAGEGVGYGVRFRADRPTTIAIIPAGYADGLDVRLAGRADVLVRGRRAPIVGSVCMDMLMADVTGLDVSPGDEVVVIGSQAAADGRVDRIDVREMAEAIGTIPYEILCRIGGRIERVYF